MLLFLGTIMVPQMVQGMVLDQRVLVPKFVSTTSDQQGLGKSVFHLTNDHVEARHTGLPLVTHAVPQTGVSSILTPQMNSLKISKGPPQQSVFAERRDQSAQTDDKSHGLTATASVSDSELFLVKLQRKVASESTAFAKRSANFNTRTLTEHAFIIAKD